MLQLPPPSDDAPPQNIPAEQATLGAMLVEPGAVDRAFAVVEEGDFYPDAHQVIFRAMVACRQRNEPVDLITVSTELRRLGCLDRIGGAEYLTALINEVPTAAHVVRYASIVAEAGVKRRLIEAAAEIDKAARKPGSDAVTALTRAVSVVDAVNERRQSAEAPGLRASALAQEIAAARWLWPGWIPIGYITGLIADPEMGKSAIALYFAGCVLGQLPWPDGTRQLGVTAPVLLCETESFLPATLHRAQAWGLDLDRIVLPPADLGLLTEPRAPERLAELARAEGCTLLIVDSLSGGHDVEENSAAVRGVLRPLWKLAEEGQLTVLVVHHLRKANPLFPRREVRLEDASGSRVFGQFLRSCMAIDQPDPRGVKRLSVVKANLTIKPSPIGFYQTEAAAPSWTEAPVVPGNIPIRELADQFVLSQLQTGPKLQCELIKNGQMMHSLGQHQVTEALRRINASFKGDTPEGKVWSLEPRQW